MLRALIPAGGAGAIFAVYALAFCALGPTAPETKPPEPSGGTWASEDEIGPLDLVPGAPSPFAPTEPSEAEQSDATTKTK